MRYRILLVLWIVNGVSLFASHLFVAPDGNDSNIGTIKKPLQTLQKAQRLAKYGDTVFIRGGHYKMSEKQIARQHRIWAYVTELNKDGINYFAYKDEKPVFDYAHIRTPNKRLIAFYITGNDIHLKGFDVIKLQSTIKKGNSQSECFEINGGNQVIIENVNMHDNMAIGVYIIHGKNNLILNCDAYRNYDYYNRKGYGGNTDGFGVHVKKGDTGNILRGCRAWLNSDDGFDTINSAEPVLIDQCWAFFNGFSTNDGTIDNITSRGDGNGFKIGGYGKDRSDFEDLIEFYAPIPSNTVQFCIAANNKQSGFYANHHLEGNDWIHNSAFANKRNFNMLNCKALNAIDYGIDVPGKDHYMVNNLGYGATIEELANIDKEKCILLNNYFDLDFTITSSDFVSLDVKDLMLPRQKNGNLPIINFLQLAPSSRLKDIGLDISLPFNDKAPDLGALESTAKN